MKIVQNENAEFATARSNIYKLLASVYRTSPSVDLINELKGEELSGILSQLDFPIEDHLPSASPHQLIEDLDFEYTRLFIGPGSHISPHESIHTDNTGRGGNELWGPETVKVKAFVEEAGLAISDDFEGMPDHISAEFEFMGELSAHEAKLWVNDKAEEAENCFEIQKRFFLEHTDQWVPIFCSKIIAREDAAFYKDFARLTIVVQDFERETFKQLSEERAIA